MPRITMEIPEPRLLEPSDLPADFEDPYWYDCFAQEGAEVFDFADGKTLFMRHNNAFSGNEIELIDVGHEGEVHGVGSMWAHPDMTPYVSYTGTNLPYQRRGLGLRRLHLMNHLANEIVGDFLHSAPFGDTSPEAAAVWDKLVSQSKAEVYTDETFRRYRFITLSPTLIDLAQFPECTDRPLVADVQS